MKTSRKTRHKEFLRREVRKFKTFFSSEDLFEEAKKKNAGISIATVYRFMNEEVKKGNLHSYQCDRRTVYSKRKQHCQFTCQKTGEVIHFDVDSIDFLKKKDSRVNRQLPDRGSGALRVVRMLNECFPEAFKTEKNAKSPESHRKVNKGLP